MLQAFQNIFKPKSKKEKKFFHKVWSTFVEDGGEFCNGRLFIIALAGIVGQIPDEFTTAGTSCKMPVMWAFFF